MIIDLKKIKRSGKDSEGFHFEYQVEKQLTDLPNVKIRQPIDVAGTVTLTGDHSCYIDGQVRFTLEGECTRCLQQTEKQFVIDFADSADSDSDDCYPVKNDTVDLSKIVDDVVVINTPVSFLCREDCKGICVGCGVNLNDGECKCKN